jgi:hypothetical protein
MPGIYSELEAEIYDLRQRLVEAESDGAEIALHAERNAIMLRNEIIRLQSAGPEKNDDGHCSSCKHYELIIAELTSSALIFWGIPLLHLSGVRNFVLACIVCFIPVFCILIPWWRYLFIRKFHWRSWRDNQIYRSMLRRIKSWN